MAVEAHKGACAFMPSAEIQITLPQYSAAVHSTLPQYFAAVCSTTGASGHGFDIARFDMARFDMFGGVIGLGPRGWMHFCAYIH